MLIATGSFLATLTFLSVSKPLISFSCAPTKKRNFLAIFLEENR